MHSNWHGLYKFFPRGLRRKDQGGHNSMVHLWSSSSSCQATRCVWGHWRSQCQLKCLLSIKQMRTYQMLDVLKFIDILQLFTDIFKLIFEVAGTKKISLQLNQMLNKSIFTFLTQLCTVSFTHLL